MKHGSPISGNARRPDEGETPSRAFSKGVVVQPKLGFENAGVKSKLDSSPNAQLGNCCCQTALSLSLQ